MKNYILSYKDFLNNLTPLNTSKLQEDFEDDWDEDYEYGYYNDYDYKQIQVVKNVKTIHEKIFGDQERIYLPFDPTLFNINLDKSELQEEIETLLTSNGYEIISYTQNQCVKTGQKNITKIGKVLVSKNINRKDLADAYGQEVDRLRVVKDSSDLLVVFSRNYHDIITMSTDKAWDSCQNLYHGSHKHFVAKDLEQGSIIAYLIKSTDKEIFDPEARILIKPFINTTNSNDIVLLPCTKTYHRGLKTNTPLAYPKFPEFVMSWVKQVQPNINGTYKMNNKVYQDGSTELKIKKPVILSKEEKERIENPKTVEDLKFAFDYYDIDLDISRVEMDSDGLWTYNGTINFSNDKDFKEFPNCFKNLKEIKGSLYCFKTPLKDFKGLERLEKIGGSLKCNNTSIKDFTGLERLETIGEDLDCFKTPLKDFKGLERLENIGEYLMCYETPSLTSFIGLERLEKIGQYLDCSRTSITSFIGLERLEKIGGYLMCYETPLKDFKGLERLEKIGGSLYCYETSIKDFTGLERLETIGKDLDCSRTSIKDFTGLSKNIKINGGIEPKKLKDVFDKFKNS